MTADMQFMLTTTDNPFDPFVQFDEWLAFDEQQGYYSCAYLARVATSSDELSDQEQTVLIEDAIDEIVKYNLSGRHIKVEKGKFVTGRSVDDMKS